MVKLVLFCIYILYIIYFHTLHTMTRLELFSVIFLRRKCSLCSLLFPTLGRGKASHSNWENKRNSSRCLSMFFPSLNKCAPFNSFSVSLAVAAIKSNHSDNYGYKCTVMLRVHTNWARHASRSTLSWHNLHNRDKHECTRHILVEIID